MWALVVANIIVVALYDRETWEKVAQYLSYGAILFFIHITWIRMTFFRKKRDKRVFLYSLLITGITLAFPIVGLSFLGLLMATDYAIVCLRRFQEFGKEPDEDEGEISREEKIIKEDRSSVVKTSYKESINPSQVEIEPENFERVLHLQKLLKMDEKEYQKMRASKRRLKK